MATARFYEKNGTEKGTQDLPGKIFECEIKKSIVHQAVVTHLANQRQGNAATKERSDVRGGGRKPFRQKGTGRARQGTIRSPIHKGGGVVFGPHPRDYRKSFPKKMKRQALTSSLSSRAKDGSIFVVEDLEFNEPKTKQFADLLKGMDCLGKKVLFVMEKPDAMVVKSSRNVPRVKVTLANMVNTYDVVWADRVVMTQSSLKVMEEVFVK